MKMSDVKVGMRLRSTAAGDVFSPITVTAITERGFQYSLDRECCIHPRLGMTVEKDGHEHYGHDGEVFYELIEDKAGPDINNEYTKVEIALPKNTPGVDPARVAMITFHAADGVGSTAIYPRGEIVDWVRRWLLRT